MQQMIPLRLPGEFFYAIIGLMLKGNEMKVLFTSLVFTNVDGTPRKFLIPAEAATTYAKRDIALRAMIELGGIHAKPTPEFMAIRKKMLSAKRKIERQGWHSISM
jgi:hypothetical protein